MLGNKGESLVREGLNQSDSKCAPKVERLADMAFPVAILDSLLKR